MSDPAISALDSGRRVARDELGAAERSPASPGWSAASADLALASPDLSPDAIEVRHRGENFPVVLRGLPARRREELLALYGFARWVDEMGDAAPGDRLALLDDVSRDLERIAHGEPRHPILRRLAPVVRAHDLKVATLERLVEANRRDQTLGHVETWDALLDSCAYSANPVGELVLGLFDAADPVSIALSDAICSGLQVVEHCQDVREDFEHGRIYLPAEDMARFGCRASELGADVTSPALAGVLQLQVERARGLFHSADGLLPRLRGLAVPLVAAYAAGGVATCDALERHRFEVLAQDVRPARRDVVGHALRLVGRAWLARVGRARARARG